MCDSAGSHRSHARIAAGTLRKIPQYPIWDSAASHHIPDGASRDTAVSYWITRRISRHVAGSHGKLRALYRGNSPWESIRFCGGIPRHPMWDAAAGFQRHPLRDSAASHDIPGWISREVAGSHGSSRVNYRGSLRGNP